MGNIVSLISGNHPLQAYSVSTGIHLNDALLPLDIDPHFGETSTKGWVILENTFSNLSPYKISHGNFRR